VQPLSPVVLLLACAMTTPAFATDTEQPSKSAEANTSPSDVASKPLDHS